MSNRSFLIGTVFVIALLGVSDQALAETVILRASGPSAAGFAPGQRLGDLAQIRLIEGDNLSLLLSGSTVELRGPYHGPVRVSKSVESRSFNWLAMLKSPRRARAAGSRSPEAQKLPTD